MTDDQINQAIYEACGDYVCECCKDICKDCDRNYCTDLNAMHEAENTLAGQQFPAYTFVLNDIEGSLWGIRATARQRAEAFLRTLGKWEEDK